MTSRKPSTAGRTLGSASVWTGRGSDAATRCRVRTASTRSPTPTSVRLRSPPPEASACLSQLRRNSVVVVLAECDKCVVILIRALAEADFNITEVIGELENVLVHANDTARLNAINETVTELRVRMFSDFR